MRRYPHMGFFGELTAEDERKIEEALQTVHASHLTERFFDELSDGEKQKVLVARAFVQEPEVIILDELTTGILHENDVDFEVARTIGLDILQEKAFEPIQEKTFLQALKKVDAVPSIIDAGSPIGTGNDKNRAIIEYALTKGKNVYSLRSEQEQAMLFDQYASRIHFCANVSNVIEKMSFL